MPSVRDPIVATERAISQFQRFSDDAWGEHLVTGMIGGALLWAEMNLGPDEGENRDERMKRLVMEGAAEYRRLRKAYIRPRGARRRPRILDELRFAETPTPSPFIDPGPFIDFAPTPAATPPRSAAWSPDGEADEEMPF